MARYFVSGSSQYIQYQTGTTLGFPLTMACWFRAYDTTTDQTVLSVEDPSGNSFYALQLRGSTAGDPIRARAQEATASGNAAFSTTGYSANTWHHAAGVFTNASSRACFIDGGSKGTDVITRTPANCSDVIVGGLLHLGGQYATADIAEVAIWTRALTDAEIAMLGAGASPLSIQSTSLLYYAPLWGSNSPEIEMLSGGNWTLGNAPTESTSHPPVSYANGYGILGVVATPAATTASRTLAARLMIDWDFDDSFTNETAYLVSASGQLRFHPPGTGIWSGSGIVDRMTVTLANSTGRFSPLNSGGALYADIGSGYAYNAPMYLEVSIDGGSNYDRVFTGVIKIPQESGSTTKETATVTIDCRSNEESILSKRLSTTEYYFGYTYAQHFDDGDYITAALTAAGIDGGDMDIDDGTFIIPWVWADQGSPVEMCWRLAAAAGGRFYADPDGNFVYDNARAWLENANSTSSQATLTTSGFQRLQPYYNDTELYESVTVVSYPRDIGVSDTIWESDVVYTVPAGETVVINAEFDNPAYIVDDASYDAVSSGGVDLSGSVTLTQTDYAQHSTLSFANGHATQAALVQNVVITGQPVENTNEATKAATSSDGFWTDRNGRDRTLTGNEWIQTQAQLNSLSEFLRDRHETPRLFWRVSGVPGDPARRLGDRITMTDASMSVSSRDAFVIAIDWTYSAGGPFVQNYEAVDAADLYEYIDDADGYFVINVNELNDGAHVFY